MLSFGLCRRIVKKRSDGERVIVFELGIHFMHLSTVLRKFMIFQSRLSGDKLCVVPSVVQQLGLPAVLLIIIIIIIITTAAN
ncbi:hypothetical protein F2P81_012165 [Scophthalmus maximus]|uniref:Uncharacterized protein n=1 Tax=Scophthalmus maximus TaxID=52904 RepID=A0A6A4SML1_SCOMX|nr:hypothetical protein F2P81_012165 [Scophthalmus maximus]